MVGWPRYIGVPDAIVFEQMHAPQTKMLEGRANIRERIFKALFTYVSTRFGLRSKILRVLFMPRSAIIWP